MGWGSSWEEDASGKAIAERQAEQSIHPLNELIQETGKIILDMVPSVYDMEAVEPNLENLVKAYAKVYNNRKPTHDPYTNPDATIYYECSCGQILDPDTKSFAQLNNYASEKGWKIRFTDKGYVPYCVKCGEWVE